MDFMTNKDRCIWYFLKAQETAVETLPRDASPVVRPDSISGIFKWVK